MLGTVSARTSVMLLHWPSTWRTPHIAVFENGYMFDRPVEPKVAVPAAWMSAAVMQREAEVTSYG